jgi:hypothetical protein
MQWNSQCGDIIHFIEIILLWVTTRRLVKIENQRCRTYYLSHLQG